MKKLRSALFIVLLLGLSFVGLSQFAPATLAQDDVGEDLGHIEPPPGVEDYQAEAGLAADQPALIFFLSRMITLITIIAGLWTIVNVVIAGYFYLSAGDSAETHSKVSNLLTMSVVGLLLIVSAYTIGGVIGVLFFGDATYILSPTL